jgi:hypothetical protein
MSLSMDRRSLREFQRLLARSDEMTDLGLLKSNSRLLESKFSDLRSSNSLSSEQISEYSARLKTIQQRLTPQIVLPKPKPRFSALQLEEDTEDISKERIKQDEITNDLLRATYKLRENVGKVSTVTATDAEVLSGVAQNMEGIADGAHQTQSKLMEVKSERLGWKVYYWLVLVILTYIVVTFIFL